MEDFLLEPVDGKFKDIGVKYHWRHLMRIVIELMNTLLLKRWRKCNKYAPSQCKIVYDKSPLLLAAINSFRKVLRSVILKQVQSS